MRLPALLLKQIKENLPGKLGAFGVQGGGAAVDVVVAFGARRESEIAEAERIGRQQVEELVASGGVHRPELTYQAASANFKRFASAGNHAWLHRSGPAGQSYTSCERARRALRNAWPREWQGE